MAENGSKKAANEEQCQRFGPHRRPSSRGSIPGHSAPFYPAFFPPPKAAHFSNLPSAPSPNICSRLAANGRPAQNGATITKDSRANESLARQLHQTETTKSIICLAYNLRPEARQPETGAAAAAVTEPASELILNQLDR